MPRIIAVFIALVASGQVLFKSDTSLVNILATVHDDKGRVVRSLTKEDFWLVEDGRPREIHDFAAQSDLPLTLALLVDTSGSMRLMLDYEQQASVAFLKDALRPGRDRAAIFQFDSEVGMLSDVEGSEDALAQAVQRIKPTPPDRSVSEGPKRTTALFDAIVEASNKLGPISGRKAIIVLTDGLDVWSNHSMNEAVESALRSDTAVYSILVQPSIFSHSNFRLPPANALRYQAFTEMNSAKGRAVLLGLSGQTGGYEFEMTANRSVTAIYTAITDDLRNQYRLGLACDGENCKPGYHSLMLGTRTAGQTVQSRQGFFAGDQKFNLSTDVLPAWVAKNISGESAAPAEPGLVAARRLALGQREQPVSFVADESLECDGLGKGGTAICKGTAKVHFDWATRMVTRQAKLSAGTTLQMTGVTNFGEFGVEVSNIFRSLTLQQFQPAERGAPMPFGLREFDFMADSSSSAWQVWDGARWLTIPYVGAIWIDPADGSIVRLQRTSTRLPATMPVGLIQSEIEFSSATVGSESVLMLPARTRERICERGEDACLEISSVVNSYSPP